MTAQFNTDFTGRLLSGVLFLKTLLFEASIKSNCSLNLRTKGLRDLYAYIQKVNRQSNNVLVSVALEND